MSSITETTHAASRQHHDKLSIIRLACLLSTFMAITFVGCVIAGYFLPGLRGMMPVSAFPGFSWENPSTAISV